MTENQHRHINIVLPESHADYRNCGVAVENLAINVIIFQQSLYKISSNLKHQSKLIGQHINYVELIIWRTV